ncbi:MAG: helix-turn-helix transcriptional regulator [Clostridia bacterium]|nr:helix-turn-helix transcriptional regulator [Clostridia bacterium]
MIANLLFVNIQGGILVKNIFAERLSALRKERKISQKEAASAFGISQALLSHYENGIRQCPVEFVIKAAEFYSVTTDYLLGVSDAKSATEEIIGTIHPGDVKLSYTTLRRAAGVLCRQLETSSEKQSSGSLTEPCLYLYKELVRGVCAGKIPASWLGIDSVSAARETVRIINSLNLSSDLPQNEKITLLKGDESAPQSVLTVITETRRHFADVASQMIEKISIY